LQLDTGRPTCGESRGGRCDRWGRFCAQQCDVDLIRLHGQAFIVQIAKAGSSTHIKPSTPIQ